MIQKEKLGKIVGSANVSAQQADLDAYSRDISFVNTVKPAYVVKPRNAEEVRKLVALANETSTPLVPVSSGSPHFRGDTVPGTGGAVIVDLSGMKKIIRVDRYHRVANVEPGVTFGELIQAAAKEGIRLNMPLLPRKSKSVIGSLLEREPVIMPKYQWDVSDPLATLGLVFGMGDEFRTGQAAGPGTIEEQWAAGAVQKAPYGPGTVGWHRIIQGAQGTMGIVTWASLRCELLPKIEEPFLVGDDKLARLFDLTQWLVRRRLVNECFIVNGSALASMMTKKWPTEFKSRAGGLPPWLVFYNLAGYEYFPEDRIQYQIKDIKGITQRLGLESVRSFGGISANELLKAVQQPCDEPHWKLRNKGACEDVMFLTNYDRLEDLIGAMGRLTEEAGYPVGELSTYIQPVVQGTSCHCEFNLFYSPEDRREAAMIKELSAAAVRNLSGKGAFFSRPYGTNADAIMNRDAATVTALRRMKTVFDPNHIMNPGKICY